MILAVCSRECGDRRRSRRPDDRRETDRKQNPGYRLGGWGWERPRQRGCSDGRSRRECSPSAYLGRRPKSTRVTTKAVHRAETYGFHFPLSCIGSPRTTGRTEHKEILGRAAAAHRTVGPRPLTIATQGESEKPKTHLFAISPKTQAKPSAAGRRATRRGRRASPAASSRDRRRICDGRTGRSGSDC